MLALQYLWLCFYSVPLSLYDILTKLFCFCQSDQACEKCVENIFILFIFLGTYLELSKIQAKMGKHLLMDCLTF